MTAATSGVNYNHNERKWVNGVKMNRPQIIMQEGAQQQDIRDKKGYNIIVIA
ncbi:hypothetical protein ACFLYI_00600 [Chloroflexota bacterium]